MAAAAGDSVVDIDGSELEGGGQILRNTAALSCLLCKPVRVHSIRAGRSNPGLRPQHLTGLQLISEICHGKLDGANVKSTEIKFYPQKVNSGNYMADTKTAGSICLLMQASMPCLLCGDGPSTLTLRGGTNAEMAPQVDYTIMVFKPVAEKFEMKFDCTITRRGYYPKGGGEVVIKSYPCTSLKAVRMMDRGNITRIYGRSFVAGVIPVRVAHEMAQSAQEAISEDFPGCKVDIQCVQEPRHIAVGNGTGIIVVAETDTGCILAGSALGKKGIPAYKVGREAGEMLLNQLSHGGCVDDFLQDQLIILMALAKGKSEIRCGTMTMHTETAIHVAKQLTEAKFKIQKLSGTQTVIECEGIGLVNSHFGCDNSVMEQST